MTTTLPNARKSGQQWVLIDAKGQVLGRLASRIALILRGKHKPTFTPFLDTGDFVVIINAAQIVVTGQKRVQKMYQRYSGYPGGRKTEVLGDVLERHPDRVLWRAVKGMVPDGPLGRHILTKLKIYPGAEHPHAAQKPHRISTQPVGAQQAHG